MATDIYTGKEIVLATKEHVIPSFLGGTLTASDIIDRSTNSILGHGIDSELSRALQSIRLLCDARSADGDTAGSLKAVETTIGKVNIESGFIVKPYPQVRKFISGERTLTIDATVPDERTLKDMLRKEGRRQGLKNGELYEKVRPLLTTKKVAMPEISLGMNLCTSECYRATAKIACNYFALHCPELFRTEEFNSIRLFVWEGLNPKCPPVQATDVNICNQGFGRVDHLVRFFIDDAGDVISLVTYFGAFSFLVRLGSASGHEIAGHSYRVDQLGSVGRVDCSEDLSLDLPSFQASSEMSYEDYVALICCQLERCLSVVCDIQKDVWLQRVIEPHWRKLSRASNGLSPTAEQWKSFVEELVADVMSELAPNISETARKKRERLMKESAPFEGAKTFELEPDSSDDK